MKSREEVEKRLRKLRRRYAHRYVLASQERKPDNCKHHETMTVPDFDYAPPIEHEIAPRLQHTLLVLQDPAPTESNVCFHKMDGGRICDSVESAKSCPYFEPALPLEEARSQFMELLDDNEYVFDHYRDVATLQWVLGERVYDMHVTWIDRVMFWFFCVFSRTPAISATAPVILPETMWEEDNDTPPTSGT